MYWRDTVECETSWENFLINLKALAHFHMWQIFTRVPCGSCSYGFTCGTCFTRGTSSNEWNMWHALKSGTCSHLARCSHVFTFGACLHVFTWAHVHIWGVLTWGTSSHVSHHMWLVFTCGLCYCWGMWTCTITEGSYVDILTVTLNNVRVNRPAVFFNQKEKLYQLQEKDDKKEEGRKKCKGK